MSGTAVRARQLVLSLLLATGAAGAVIMMGNRQEGEPLLLEVPTPQPTLTVAPTPSPAPIVVFVSGAVRRPGVYTLPPDSRVVDALEAAGGPSSEAAIEALNQATRLSDGMQVHMPAEGSAPPPAPLSQPGEGEAGGQGGESLVPINSADAALLQSLPGIGPALASRIVDYRDEHGPFTSVEQLLEVRGIGEKLLETIRERIVLD